MQIPHVREYQNTLSIFDFSWLERYDAFTIYRLGKQGWCVYLGDDGRKNIENWENSSGRPLYIGDDTSKVYFVLLTLVLPKITSFQMDLTVPIKYYVKLPRQGWKATLKVWNDYITSPVGFDSFIEYIGKNAHFLYYNTSYTTLLNLRYKDRLLKSFQSNELEQLARLFYKLTSERHINRQSVLTNTESELFQRALQALGDLEISSVTKSWRIDSFKI